MGTVDLEWFDFGQTCFSNAFFSHKTYAFYLHSFCQENMVLVPQIAFFGAFAEFVPTATFTFFSKSKKIFLDRC